MKIKSADLLTSLTLPLMTPCVRRTGTAWVGCRESNPVLTSKRYLPGRRSVDGWNKNIMRINVSASDLSVSLAVHIAVKLEARMVFETSGSRYVPAYTADNRRRGETSVGVFAQSGSSL